MNYGNLIARAFRITIHHRFLWLLAILAGGSGAANFQFSYGEDELESVPESLQRVSDWFLAHLYVLIALAIVLFLIILFFIVISIMAKGGLIASAARLDRHQQIAFWDAMRIGYHAFWRLLVIGLLPLLGVLTALILTALPIVGLVLAEHYFLAVIFGLACLPLVIAIAVYLGLLLLYAERFTVVESTGVIASITRAHHILFTSTKEVLLVWLLAIAFGLAVSLGSLIVLAVIALPHVIVGIAVYAGLGLIPTIIYAVIPLLVLFAASLLISGVCGAFRSSFWTLAYLDLTTPPAHTAPQPA